MRKQPQTMPSTALSQSRIPRRGISLLEVLISMFVLLVGLMGVASLFPVGSHYAAKGERYDRGAALSDAAFDELIARGLLQPKFWLYGDPNAVGDDNTIHVINSDPSLPNYRGFNITDPAVIPGRAFVIDPIGVQSALPPSNPTQEHNHFFPYLEGANETATMPGAWTVPPTTFSNPANWPIQESAWPIRRVSVPSVNANLPMPLEVADTIFSLHDTLSVELPDEDDQPAMQLWRTADPSNTPDRRDDDVLLRRQYAADYTWLATVAPVNNSGLLAMQPASNDYGNKYYDVSVAVFYKRESTPDSTSERLLEAELFPGGEIELIGPDPQTVDAAVEGLSPGEWIALAGVNQSNGAFLLKWYRLLSLDDETPTTPDAHGHYVRRAMLDGPAWPPTPAPGNPGQFLPEITDLRAIILPNIVSVTTRSMKLQQE